MWEILKLPSQDFPGDPGLRHPSMPGAGWIPGGELRSHMQWDENKNKDIKCT